jgi:hypothetical protein
VCDSQVDLPVAHKPVNVFSLAGPAGFEPATKCL